MYTVTIYYWFHYGPSHADQILFTKEVELPFPPFIGLILDINDVTIDLSPESFARLHITYALSTNAFTIEIGNYKSILGREESIERINSLLEDARFHAEQKSIDEAFYTLKAR